MSFHLSHRAGLVAVIASAMLITAGVQTASFAAPTPSSRLRTYDINLLGYLNHARTSQGLAPLKQSNRLYVIAHKWAVHEAATGSFAHNPQYGAEVRTTCPGWRNYGENTGWQDGTNAKALFNLYMNDPPHRANMLSHVFTDVGIATVRSSNGKEWNVMDFANHCA